MNDVIEAEIVKPKRKYNYKTKTGRPTLYKPEFCQMLIDHMAQGKSMKSFGPKIGVIEDTLYRWVKEIPQFSESYKIALSHNYSYWEDVGINQAEGKISGSAAAYIFNMKNRFGWTDKQESHNTTTINITIDAPQKNEILEIAESDIALLNE